MSGSMCCVQAQEPLRIVLLSNQLLENEKTERATMKNLTF